MNPYTKISKRKKREMATNRKKREMTTNSNTGTHEGNKLWVANCPSNLITANHNKYFEDGQPLL